MSIALTEEPRALADTVRRWAADADVLTDTRERFEADVEERPALLADLVRRGRQADLGVLLARICTEGEASIALHRRQGFSTIGIMRRVGEKFGRVLDIELMDLQLDDTP